jgi:hypothetical protein
MRCHCPQQKNEHNEHNTTKKKKIRVRTFDLSKGALCDIFCDGVLPQLRWGKDVGEISHGDEGRLEDVDGAIADGGSGVAVVGFLGLGASYVSNCPYLVIGMTDVGNNSYWLGNFGF